MEFLDGFQLPIFVIGEILLLKILETLEGSIEYIYEICENKGTRLIIFNQLLL